MRFDNIDRSFNRRFSAALIHLPRTIGRLMRWPFIRIAFHGNGRSRGWLRSLRSPPTQKWAEFFDAQWYTERYVDVSASGLTPIQHFIRHGAAELRDPNPAFDADWYLRAYPDVASARRIPIEHFVLWGAAEGRLPFRDFDVYLRNIGAAHDDVLKAYRHYLKQRPRRGIPVLPRAAPGNADSLRNGSDRAPALFDGDYYLERNSDVAKAGVDPYWHFVHYGWREGRNPNEFFDVSWYLEQNTDVHEGGVDPLNHYIEHGWKEGRDPGPKFSVKNYLDRYRDVLDSGSEPLEHYIRYGKQEGRLLGESYSSWIAKYDTLNDKIRGSMRKRIARLALQPKFSVIMPVYDTELVWLREAIESVREQLYPHWEICISDNASTRPGLKELLREYAVKDERIRVVFRDTNGHISANSNSALSVATGDYVVLMDSDDLLPEDALYWVAEEINAHPDADLIYSDEDKIDTDGRRYEPYFKPDWNPALMMSQNMFSHLGVYRRSLVEMVGGFRLGFEGSQDHDLVLRCADATEESKIRHIPHILYHWRAIPESTATSPEVKPYAWNAGARAIEEHLARNGIKGQVTRALNMFYQVRYDPPGEWPKVSIVMPSGCKLELLRPCLSNLLSGTTYPNFEVLLTVNEIRFQNVEQAACLKEFAKDPRVHVLVYKDCDFNYSWINNWAAKQASGSILCLMNDDVKIITSDWLEKFVVRLQLNRVGAVGGQLYYPNETIQHAGVILGIHGVAAHAFQGLRRGSGGYVGRASLEQDLSCVTAACIAVRREVFEELNGLDERFAIAFNDVDFCIRLRMKGWRIICTPEVEHYHLESQTIGRHDSGECAPLFQNEIRMIRGQWGAILDSDPFYNPNLSLEDDNMALAFPPRAPKGVIAGAAEAATKREAAICSEEPLKVVAAREEELQRAFAHARVERDQRLENLSAALDRAERTIAHVSERYANALKKNILRRLRDFVMLAFKGKPVRASRYKLIRNSVFFDENFYLAENPDVRAARLNPVIHYLRYGGNEGRNPGPHFSELGYRALNPDLPKWTLPSLEHYERFGRKEGRRLLGGQLHSDPMAAPRSVAEELSAIPSQISSAYADWIRNFDALTPRDRDAIARQIADFAYRPLISVVVTLYNTPAGWLKRCINSVRDQLYQNWELCLVDAASPQPHVTSICLDYAAADSRIKFVRRNVNGHVAGATNTALSLAKGEFVAFLDHDDELAAHALYLVADALQRNQTLDLIFSDEDKIDDQGTRYEPWFKSDWNYDLMLSQNVVAHLTIYRRSILEEISGCREGFDGSQDYDVTLRFIERTGADRICHLPYVLYHRRAIAGSVAVAPDQKEYAYEAGARAIQEHLDRTRTDALVVREARRGYYRVHWPLPNILPKVTVIIPTKDKVELLRNAVGSILKKTNYSNFDILIVNNRSESSDALEYLGKVMKTPSVRVLDFDHTYNYSALNNWAVQQTDSPILAFVNNDIEVIAPDWLHEMVSLAIRPDVGAVGAKLYYPNETIQHAGIVVGIGGLANHPHARLRRDEPGYFGRAVTTQQFSAVTAACMVMRRDVFLEMAGFDEIQFAIAYSDVDLGLRLTRAGYRVIWTPYAELYHHESATLGPPKSPQRKEQFERESRNLQSRWQDVIDNDPFYNLNLTTAGIDFSLAVPPRVRKPWDCAKAK